MYGIIANLIFILGLLPGSPQMSSAYMPFVTDTMQKRPAKLQSAPKDPASTKHNLSDQPLKPESGVPQKNNSGKKFQPITTGKTNNVKFALIKNAYWKTFVQKDALFDVFSLFYPKHKIKMLLNDKDNVKIRSIDRALTDLAIGAGKEILFVTNGGMYEPGNSPKGLYIENGKIIVPLDKIKKGNGNFYIQPNGIFFVTGTKAMITTTEQFEKKNHGVLFATQSGPMLVANGMINTSFNKTSGNKNIRSGVGIDDKGAVVFAISNNDVTFYSFADFFKNTLHCNNALYLDGSISQMYAPRLGRVQKGGDFGVLIYAETGKP